MQKPCAVCGKSFEAQRPQAKFCSSTCRTRNHRAPDGDRKGVRPKAAPDAAGLVSSVMGQADPPPAAGDTGPPPDSQMYAPVGLVATVVKELNDAKRTETVLGQLALKLAVRLEASTFDTGSSFRALSQELRAVMVAATAGAHVEDDEVDELQKRRDEKEAAARAANAATS